MVTTSCEWRPRGEPLTPTAVAARGQAAFALTRRLLARDDAALAALRGVAGADTLLVIGTADLLPWTDGAVYLGRDPQAPALLLPTHAEPAVCAALFERALRAAFPENSPPLAVLPAERIVVSANAARPISRAVLLEWLEKHP